MVRIRGLCCNWDKVSSVRGHGLGVSDNCFLNQYYRVRYFDNMGDVYRWLWGYSRILVKNIFLVSKRYWPKRVRLNRLPNRGQGLGGGINLLNFV
jgi:hypothetical protein